MRLSIMAPPLLRIELRELGNVLQPRVRDLVTATQVQAGELRELGNVLQPRVRDLVTATQVQAGELRELGNVLQPRVRDLATATKFRLVSCVSWATCSSPVSVILSQRPSPGW